MTRGGAGKGHRRVMINAAVERAVDHDGPARITFGHFHHRHALQVLQLAHVVGIRGCAVLGRWQISAAVGVFVVYGDQLVPLKGESFHAVSIFTKDHVRPIQWTALGDVISPPARHQRIAPTHQNIPDIPIWNMDVEVSLNVDGGALKTVGHRARSGRCCLERACPHHRSTRPKGQNAAQKPTPRDGAVDDTIKIICFRTREGLFVPIVG